MQKWEYCICQRPMYPNNPALSFDKTFEMLKELGSQGWELVAVDPAGYGVMYFKRPVKE